LDSPRRAYPEYFWNLSILDNLQGYRPGNFKQFAFVHLDEAQKYPKMKNKMDTSTQQALSRVPTQEIVREAVSKLFEMEGRLWVDPESWRYTALPENGISEARFALMDGNEAIFRDVLVLAWYDEKSPRKLQVKASIRGLSSTTREFFVG
jgi:hypothetical protein